MGAYLSTPVRDKESKDFDGEFLSYGASSMQGWRMTQEDAHSCQVDFDADNKTSLFAVYDGHGGAEVAQYSSMHFPSYLKKLLQNEKGLVKAALEEAFLGFDATLTDEIVVRQLKELAGVENDSDEVDEEVKNEAAALCEEASMPLEKVLERYGGQACTGPIVSKTMYSLRKRQKFQSPMVRNKAEDGDSELSKDDADGDVAESSVTISSSTSAKKDDVDEVKLKLEDKLINGCCEEEAAGVQPELKDGEPAEDLNVQSSEPVQNREPQQSSEPVQSDSVESSTASVPDAVPIAEAVTETALAMADSNGSEMDSSAIEGSGTTAETGSNSCSNQSSAELQESSSSSMNPDLECSAAGTSNPSCSSKVADDGSEEDTEEEDEDDSEDEENKWNEEAADDDSSDDDDDDDGDDGGFNFDEEDDEDEDDEVDEDEEAMETMGWNEEPGADSGCTAVVALLQGRELYVANAGDSRCVLCRDGKAVEMSDDHKPEDLPEHERIVKAGGKVTADGRVNGGLNLSRALGDHSYKRNKSVSAREQMITALPDVRCITINEKDKFMILACDGIWNVMTSQDVVDFVQRRLDDGVTKLSTICEELFDFCLAPDTTGDGTGCDNMTCVIIRFNKLHDNTEASKKRKAEDDVEDSAAAKRSRDSEDKDSKDL